MYFVMVWKQKSKVNPQLKIDPQSMLLVHHHRKNVPFGFQFWIFLLGIVKCLPNNDPNLLLNNIYGVQVPVFGFHKSCWSIFYFCFHEPDKNVPSSATWNSLLSISSTFTWANFLKLIVWFDFRKIKLQGDGCSSCFTMLELIGFLGFRLGLGLIIWWWTSSINKSTLITECHLVVMRQRALHRCLSSKMLIGKFYRCNYKMLLLSLGL